MAQSACTRSDFEALLRRAGLDVPSGKIDDLYSNWRHIEVMLSRLRPEGRARAAEPGHLFVPGQP
jgi:hypothetical protein